MSSLLLELGSNQILNTYQVGSIRRYITLRYPSFSSQKKAALFATALNKILDNNIPNFAFEDKQKLKSFLFKDIISNANFSISLYDVFTATLKLKTIGNLFFKEMRSWLSQVLKQSVSKESLFKFVLESHKLMIETPGKSIKEILNQVERFTGGIQTELSKIFAPTIVAPINVFPPSVVIPTLEAQSPKGIHPSLSIKPSLTIQSSLATQNMETFPFDENLNSFHMVSDFPEIQPYREIIELPTISSMSTIFTGLSNEEIYGSTITESIYDYINRLKNFLSILKQKYLVKNSDIIKGLVLAGFVATISVTGTIAGFVTNVELPTLENSKFFYNSGLPISELDKTHPADMHYGTIIKKLNMKATAYDLSVESCGKKPSHPEYGITFSGKRATQGRTVAVDPKVIPLGSKLRIFFPEKYSQLTGLYIAEDTGRLIKGNMLDIFMGEDKAGSKKINKEVFEFGIQKVEVQIVE